MSASATLRLMAMALWVIAIIGSDEKRLPIALTGWLMFGLAEVCRAISERTDQ